MGGRAPLRPAPRRDPGPQGRRVRALRRLPRDLRRRGGARARGRRRDRRRDPLHRHGARGHGGRGSGDAAAAGHGPSGRRSLPARGPARSRARCAARPRRRAVRRRGRGAGPLGQLVRRDSGGARAARRRPRPRPPLPEPPRLARCGGGSAGACRVRAARAPPRAVRGALPRGRPARARWARGGSRRTAGRAAARSLGGRVARRRLRRAGAPLAAISGLARAAEVPRRRGPPHLARALRRNRRGRREGAPPSARARRGGARPGARRPPARVPRRAVRAPRAAAPARRPSARAATPRRSPPCRLRRGALPAGDGEGAPPRVLAEVAVENVREALGAGAAAAAAALAGRLLPEVARDARPVAVDGKLQRWEWLVLPGGEIVKADALDHHADHALVGCQDALWELARAVRAAAPGAAPRCLPFYEAAYAAFELGRWTLAAADPDLDDGERVWRRGQAGRLAAALRRVLGPRALGADVGWGKPDRPQ